jgi:hypothetical protein
MMDTHAFEIIVRGNPVRLCIGVPKGRKRPALWIDAPHPANDGGNAVILAQFHSEPAAYVAVQFMEDITEEINRVIEHLKANPPQ